MCALGPLFSNRVLQFSIFPAALWPPARARFYRKQRHNAHLREYRPERKQRASRLSVFTAATSKPIYRRTGTAHFLVNETRVLHLLVASYFVQH